MTCDFWIVIPAFSEAERLPPYLRMLAAALSEAPFHSRIQVVDDGSPAADRAALEAALEYCRREFPLINPLHALPANRGKGAAVRAGWDLAPADTPHLVFLDADGSTPAAEVVRVLSCIPRSDSKRVWIGSRQRVDGRVIQRNFFRHVVGRIFAACVVALFQTRIHDTQCGFKCIPHEAYRRIRFQLHEDRFVFDVELLLALHAAGCDTAEVPIDWSHTAGGKISFLRDAPAMLLGLARIRGRRYRGERA